jgi:conserved oligomeric Golgi complex subunit 4
MVKPKKTQVLSLEEVQHLTNILEIEAVLNDTLLQERELEQQMEESMYSDKQILEKKLELLEVLPTKLKPIYSQIQTLSTRIEETCNLAETVSKKVRLLDTTKHKLQQTQQRLEDIIHVRDCIEGIEGAIKNEEWERACDYIKTYLTIVTQENADESNINNNNNNNNNNSNNNNMIESSPRKKGKEINNANNNNVLEESNDKLLKQKLTELREIIKAKAEKAETEEEVKRFCLLFAPLGIPQIGLQKYTSFIRNSLRTDAEKILTALRKSIGLFILLIHYDSLLLF